MKRHRQEMREMEWTGKRIDEVRGKNGKEMREVELTGKRSDEELWEIGKK
jgi:hypothetical protein